MRCRLRAATLALPTYRIPLTTVGDEETWYPVA
jgi:hypothetical protein